MKGFQFHSFKKFFQRILFVIDPDSEIIVIMTNFSHGKPTDMHVYISPTVPMVVVGYLWRCCYVGNTGMHPFLVKLLIEVQGCF